MKRQIYPVRYGSWKKVLGSGIQYDQEGARWGPGQKRTGLELPTDFSKKDEMETKAKNPSNKLAYLVIHRKKESDKSTLVSCEPVRLLSSSTLYEKPVPASEWLIEEAPNVIICNNLSCLGVLSQGIDPDNNEKYHVYYESSCNMM